MLGVPACREGLFFSAEWREAVIRDRSGIIPREIVTGRPPAFARTEGLTGGRGRHREEQAKPS
ncbi:hypothetical protein [Sphaerisporangium corydalis]|uniref:Uncharacterized protein n=1 Tax=Sphaerisporangium corydalis TaxID=1441875 RepID=A0ABV9EAS3_9ACTN|nr:hypothetical protein [Sphaerisporangium corydalis]